MSTVETYPTGTFPQPARLRVAPAHTSTRRPLAAARGLALYVLVVVIAFFNHSKSGDPHPPFLFGTTAGDGAVGSGVGVAIFMYIIGTTYAGAEWSQRTIVALLFWEPRRWRVMHAQGPRRGPSPPSCSTIVSQIVWLLTAFVASPRPGGSRAAQGFWSDLLIRARARPALHGLRRLAGFGIANLVRVSAASLGSASSTSSSSSSSSLSLLALGPAVPAAGQLRPALLHPAGGSTCGDSSLTTREAHQHLHGGLEWGIVLRSAYWLSAAFLSAAGCGVAASAGRASRRGWPRSTGPPRRGRSGPCATLRRRSRRERAGRPASSRRYP